MLIATNFQEWLCDRSVVYRSFRCESLFFWAKPKQIDAFAFFFHSSLHHLQLLSIMLRQLVSNSTARKHCPLSPISTCSQILAAHWQNPRSEHSSKHKSFSTSSSSSSKPSSSRPKPTDSFTRRKAVNRHFEETETSDPRKQAIEEKRDIKQFRAARLPVVLCHGNAPKKKREKERHMHAY